MTETIAAYASPDIEKAVAMGTKTKARTITVTMRPNKDVPRFLKKLDFAQKKARQNSIQFD
ncbi:MAG: hypothetical protein ACOC6C_03320 [Verrucomicrobiota bacterium]